MEATKTTMINFVRFFFKFIPFLVNYKTTMLEYNFFMSQLTILIPVLNEEKSLPSLVRRLGKYKKTFNINIMICDGGSRDLTLEVLKRHEKTLNFTLLTSVLEEPSIQSTINIGLNSVVTEFVMVHPVDVDAFASLKSFFNIKNPGAQIYLSPKKYENAHFLLKTQEFLLNKIRLPLFRGFVWTNCPIIQTTLYLDQKPSELGFLEDVILSDNLKGYKSIILNEPVIVSARKYISDGIFSRFFGNLYIIFLFRTGLRTASELKEMYYK